MRVLIRWFIKNESGQDLVEYALLLTFVALSSTALMTQSAGSFLPVWNGANSALLGQLSAGTSGATSTTTGSSSSSTGSSSGSSGSSSSSGSSGSSGSGSDGDHHDHDSR